MKLRDSIVLAMFSFLSASQARAEAGPPLLTDDPGTPGSNNWEINVAVTSQINHDWSSIQAPIADLNYGLGEHVQLKYEVPWVLSKDASDSQSGLDQSIAGVKWRFVDKEKYGIAISTYPQYTFHTPVAQLQPLSDFQNVGNDFLLPVEIEESAGKFDINEELGYRIVSGDSNLFLYGLATRYPLARHVALLGEVHGNILSNFRDDELMMNVGSVIRANESLNVLVSAGRSLRTFDQTPTTYLTYAGLQFIIE